MNFKPKILDFWLVGWVGCLVGWLVDWLCGWMVGQPDNQPTRKTINQSSSQPTNQPNQPTQNLIISLSKSIQNPPSWRPKSIKLEAKIVQNRSQEASWRGLGGVLGPRGPQEPKMIENVKIGYASWAPTWEPKIQQNSILRPSKR